MPSALEETSVDLQMELNWFFGERRTEYPVPVLSNVTVSALDGRSRARLWDGIIDTGADDSVFPIEVATDLRLDDVRQRVLSADIHAKGAKDIEASLSK